MTDLDDRLTDRFQRAGQSIQPRDRGEQVALGIKWREGGKSLRGRRPSSRALVRLALGAFVVAVLGVGIVAAQTDRSTDLATTADVPDGCLVLAGSEPWITLFASPAPVSCVAVAEDTVVRIFNKGFDQITIEDLPGGPITLGPDDSQLFGPIGDLLGVGVHRFSSSPVAMPEVWVVPSETSRLATLPLESDGLGPFRLGLTLDQARQAWGGALEVDESLAPGPRCWIAKVPGDPYSPLLVVEGDGGPQSTIRQVLVHRRGQAAIGQIKVGMTADEVRDRALSADLTVEQWTANGDVLEWEDEGMTGLELHDGQGRRVLIAALLTGVESGGPDAPPSAERVRQLSVGAAGGACTSPAPWNEI
jgi:hypothetical protein